MAPHATRNRERSVCVCASCINGTGHQQGAARALRAVHVRPVQCVYLDTQGVRTVCTGINVQSPPTEAAKRVAQQLSPTGACGDTRVQSSPAALAKAQAECLDDATRRASLCVSEGTCQQLLNGAVAAAESYVQSKFPGVSSKCRKGYIALVDMVFNLGTTRFEGRCSKATRQLVTWRRCRTSAAWVLFVRRLQEHGGRAHAERGPGLADGGCRGQEQPLVHPGQDAVRK